MGSIDAVRLHGAERQAGRRPGYSDPEVARALAAFEGARVGTAIAAPDGGFLDATPAFCAVVGYAREDLRCLAVDDLVVPADLAPFAAEVGAVLDGNRDGFETEAHVARGDGRVACLRLNVALVRTADGAPWFLVLQAQDVTPFKATGAALRAGEARLRLALEAAGMACWDWDAETGSTVRSPRMPALFGLPPEAANAPAGRYRARVHPDDRGAVRAAHRALLDGDDAFATEYRVLLPSGEERWLRDRGEAVRGADGRLLRGVGITQDVTEQKAAEAELRAAKAAAEDACRAKEALLRVVVHDLRTPLTAVAGYAELLRLDGPLSRQQAADLDQIVTSAAHLTGLIDGMLDLARAAAGRLVLCPEPVEAAAALEEVRAELAPQAAAKGVGLYVSVPPGLVVRADPTRLRRILLNLAGNAVKFTDRGWVTLAARADGEAVTIDVIDTGPGIAAEDLGRIFEEFGQGKAGTSGSRGGFGLGLAIAKALAEEHGGAISVTSEPGGGSTFTVRLPSAQ